jgi:hypothetical protein
MDFAKGFNSFFLQRIGNIISFDSTSVKRIKFNIFFKSVLGAPFKRGTVYITIMNGVELAKNLGKRTTFFSLFIGAVS